MSLKTASQNRASNFTFTNSRSGGGGGAGTGSVTITSIVVTDSGFNNLDDSAVGTSNSYIKIIGTGFSSSANVFVSGSQVSSVNVTYVNSTEIRVTLPSLSLGNTNIFVFNPDYSGAIWAPGITVSGFPDFTQTSYTSSTPLEVSVQLLATGDAPLTYALQAGSSLPSGCSLSSSGLITGTTTDGVYQFTVVVSDTQLQSFQYQITLTITSADEYFNRTVLAINADTDTFVRDASSNSFAITINGDTKPSAFSPYNTNWSNYFDGSGDSLSVPAGNAFAYGTGDFTIEGWFYQLSALAYGGVLYAQTVSGTNYILITAGANSATPANNLVFHFNTSGASTFLTSTNQFQLNQWNHFAVVRQSGVAYLYINGVANGSAACTQDFSNTTYNPTIGTYSHSGIYYFPGYISNIRVVKGTAVYTSAFTPPTSALTAVTNTQLLTCQSNRLIDNSTNAFAITKAGDTKVSAFGPFTETDTTTGSGYFDGSGDRLDTPTSGQFNPPGDFTIGFWFYPNSALNINQNIIGNLTGDLSTDWLIQMVSGTLNVYTNGTTARITSSSAIIPFQWNYINVTRSTGVITARVNGTSIGTYSQAGSFGSASKKIEISNATNNVNGYLSDLIFIDGTAVTSVPSSQRTANSQTRLLTLQGRRALNNHTFIDGSENSLVVTRGGNTSQGSFSPFSPAGWSNYFDGTGDYLTVADNAALTMGASSFTIEGWFYPLNYTGTDKVILIHRPVTTARGLALAFSQTTGTPYLLAGDSDNASWNLTLTGSTGATLNAWNHVAFTRNSSTWNIWLNGVSVASGTASFTLDDSSTLYLFAAADGSSTFPGYISNFRIIKGNALYTSNFTPPTSSLTAIANTSLLTCQSNRFIDNSTNNFTITKNGDTKVVNFSPFAPTAVYSPETHGASAYFDGTGDYLTLASNVLPDISGVFTYECWVYLINGAAAQIFGCWNNNTGGWGLFVSDNTSAFNGRSIVWYFGNYGSNESYRGVNSVAMTNNAWNHIAVVRNASNVWAFYVNGIERGTTTFGSGISWSENRNFTDGNPVGIGQLNSTPAQCYISDARLVIGNAVYTANFTPPTAPLTKIGGTNLLLNFNSGGIIDSTSRNVLECVGDAKIVTSTRKYGTGSFYTGATSGSHYLRAIAHPFFQFRTSNFTVEGWFLPLGSGNERTFYMHGVNTAGGLALFCGTGGVRFRSSSQTDLVYSTTISVFTHIAFVRDGNTRRIFINGTQVASDTLSFDVSDNVVTDIGASVQNASDNFRYYGYIDDLRITRFARYTANFTPPSSTFLAQ